MFSIINSIQNFRKNELTDLKNLKIILHITKFSSNLISGLIYVIIKYVIGGGCMKKNLLVVAMSAMLMIGTAITSFADTYDPQYPLKGYMEPWFVNSPVTGTTAWRSDPDNFFYQSNNHMQYAFDLAVNNRDPISLNYFGGVELAAITKLTDYPTTGLEGVNQEKLDRLSIEIREFLNSFDWRNASDYEKAVRIAKRITQADYLDQEGTQYSYSCLVEGKANCSGFSAAADLLATCVGLPVNGLGSGNHIYPTFLVDGVWLAYEPTIKNDYFTVADVYVPSYYLSGEPQLNKLGKYCKATGYEIPTSVEGKFPNISYGVIHGEQSPFIKFN